MDIILESYSPRLSRSISDHRAAWELGWHVVCYLSVAGYHTRRSLPQYNSNFKKSSSFPLALHTACALAEIFRYHIRALSGPVTPTPLDAFLCLVHSVTNLELAKTLMRGRPKPTRAGYQAFAVVRAGIGISAAVFGDVHLHRASVKCLDSFIYTRVAVFLLYYFKALDSYADIYALATYLASLMAMWEGGLSWYSMNTLNVLGLGFIVLNRWVSSQADQLIKNGGRQAYPLQSSLVRVLVHFGFAELRTIKSRQGSQALSQEIEDDYIEPKTTQSITIPPGPPSPSSAQPKLENHPRSRSSFTLRRRLSGYKGYNHNMHRHVSTGH